MIFCNLIGQMKNISFDEQLEEVESDDDETHEDEI